ncbi:conjugal transfer protein TraD [Legionella pneumophila]|uniref:conjugal transfer protein TraD n=1 Tax=Legionella pneumophila TaxID=446 RepID=UPI001A2A1F81|nr:conjugal transfer protein TraD [Legionella pneumophila]HAT9699297.1 conjugal transfer protein TraD [Legionella pneumophila subsp. pneumophila]MCZ4736338.1 conjugal transfer protein TraD [Legionella pneumophila]MDW9163142.1 conjugal transfer protein TraD [Legionella pneumophila]HAT7877865.1 conjugal transfer protein TraD [Legionella pneumophila]HAU1284703.1 conjugal transfer protein TraD [Legionella pneumophila]
MTMLEEIEKEKRLIARCERSLALERLKKRRADTRHKIELGGLIIKAGLHRFEKAIILGALDFSLELIKHDKHYENLFLDRGIDLFSSIR